MSCDEFENLVSKANLLNDLLSNRDVALYFNQAMMIQVDEISKNKNLRMTFVEFIEAIARIAEAASFAPSIPKNLLEEN